MTGASDPYPEGTRFAESISDSGQYNAWQIAGGSSPTSSAYLAGPMRNYPEFNYPLFNAVAKRLREAGWVIFNPAETDAEVQDAAEQAKNPLDVYMVQDLADVARSRCIILLPGWRESEGAMIEFTVSKLLGHPAYELPDFTEVEINPKQFGFGVKGAQEVLPTGSKERKDIPLTTGVLDYFPAALAAVAQVSKQGNDKHNPGEPLHWSRGKSMDQADCISRHLLERGGIDPDTGQRHTAQLAWRALALLQIELEEAGEAPLARGASL